MELPKVLEQRPKVLEQRPKVLEATNHQKVLQVLETTNRQKVLKVLQVLVPTSPRQKVLQATPRQNP